MVLRSFPYFVYLPAFGVGLEAKRDSKHTLADFPFPISNNPPQKEEEEEETPNNQMDKTSSFNFPSFPIIQELEGMG
ncbi:hypothetical protein CEXT_669691 [Caerostris extrusa]|uniref:Uncharacterized protein n=1 Tax=Caerostris extrusa TaxID=172846 RepID=A0AAV4MV49_CAEEX|nr:hypothetical protein CEXT_669691 [Caerostris extrusa]